MGSLFERATPAGSRPHRGLHCWLLACTLLAGLLFASQLIEIPWRSALRGYDNTFNYLWLHSAMVDGDWDFRDDLQQADTLTPDSRAGALALLPTPTGRVPNKYGIGWSLLSLPFYLLADGIVVLGRLLGLWSFERDGFNPVYQVVLQLGHAGLAIASLWLAARVVEVWTGTRTAARAGVTLVWMASPLLYYQTVDLSMSHAATFLAITVMAFGMIRARAEPERLGGWYLAGVGIGLAVIARFQAAVFAVPLAWLLVDRMVRGGRQALRAVLAVIGGALPLVALQLWAWHVVYGRWLVFSYGPEGDRFHWADPHWSSLFSPWHGLFYWHPFLLVAFGGMIGWLLRSASVAGGWAIAVGLTLYVNAAWSCWWLASAFGNRSFDAALLPLMAGVAWLLARSGPRWRTTLWTLGIAAATWNVYLLVLYRTGAISRSDPVTWVEMLGAAGRLGAAIRF